LVPRTTATDPNDEPWPPVISWALRVCSARTAAWRPCRTRRALFWTQLGVVVVGWRMSAAASEGGLMARLLADLQAMDAERDSETALRIAVHRSKRQAEAELFELQAQLDRMRKEMCQVYTDEAAKQVRSDQCRLIAQLSQVDGESLPNLKAELAEATGALQRADAELNRSCLSWIRRLSQEAGEARQRGRLRQNVKDQVEQDAQKVVAMERKLAALSSSKQVSLRVCADLESRLSSTGAGQGSEHEDLKVQLRSRLAGDPELDQLVQHDGSFAVERLDAARSRVHHAQESVKAAADRIAEDVKRLQDTLSRTTTTTPRQ
ncbi:hypothetical protein PBRA_000588, partial [Plasmodiophora brassicae]